MISRSDPEIAAWSDVGDNFVIKNVDKFSSVSHSHNSGLKDLSSVL